MIEYLSIFLIASAQVAVYLWMDKKTFKLHKLWVLLGFLIAQFFIFPQLYFSAYDFDENKCGMPILAIHLFFSIIGGGLNLITHFIYYFVTKKLKQKL